MPDPTDTLPPAAGDDNTVPPDNGGLAALDNPNDGPGENIVDLEIERELKDSYLTYAMSTIMDRALPDVRDGLKPSQRRILVAMNDLNLRPGAKHRKCSKITGDTQGNYHPHGTQVIYPTLVGLAQVWRMRVALVDPQGNFGSIDGDPPAAERYTEARMSAAAMDMLADLKLDTVDFQSNYDDTRVEPAVLPGRFPNLLVNGSVGIAVGMATSMAPHNPGEVLDSIIRVVEDPAIGLEDLMQDVTDEEGKVVRHGLKGPDFPTGGVIAGRRGILESYTTGRGRVTLRGTCHVEDLPSGKQQIVIDSIPYMLMQSTLVERIVDAVKDERIKEVSDVRNESGRNAQTRVVVELKKGADAIVVENQLYQFTPLQQTFSMNNIALVNRRPRTLTLREMITLYIAHRRDVIRRRTSHLLREAKKKAHLLEGQIYAVFDIDEVIRLIRSSQTRDEAIRRLMERRFRIPPEHPAAATIPERLKAMGRAAEAQGGVALTRVQAEQIGSMRLIQLVALEVEKLVNEYTQITLEIENYESILGDEGRVSRMIVEDCEEMRARFTSPRRTAIEEAAGDIDIESLIRVEEMAVTISRHGYAKRVALDTYQAQARGGKGIRASDFKEDDFIEHLFVASTHDDLLCFTDAGRVFKIKVYELPEMSRQSKGRPIVNLIETREGEQARVYLAIKDFESGSWFLTFVSRQGVVKRTPLKDYRNVNRSGLIAVGLREGDGLLDVLLTSGSDDLMLVTSQGMAIRFNEQDVRLMGRPAAGVKGIELPEGSEVIGAVCIPMEADADGDMMTAASQVESGLSLLTITQSGYGKRTFVDEYRVQPEEGKPRSQSRGGKGRVDIRSTPRNGPSVAALLVHESDDVVVASRMGQLVRMSAGSISSYGRGTQGVRVVRLRDEDEVVAAARVIEKEDEETPASEERTGE